MIEAMQKDSGISLKSLKVDGGASANDFLMQFQADILSEKVLRPECIETTALGAAYLAGIAVGFWKDTKEVRENWALSRTFDPAMQEEKRKEKVKGWKRAVRCAVCYTEEED